MPDAASPDASRPPEDAAAKSPSDVWIGRAVAKSQPNRGRMLDDDGGSDDASGLDGETEFDDGAVPPDALWVDRRHLRAPLIVGVVIVIAIAVAITVLVRMGAKSACPARGCAAGPSQSAAPTPSASPRSTPSTPSQPSGTVAPVAVTPPLASVMPADVDLRSCKTTDEDPFLSDVSAYFACRQGATAQVPYLQVWGYQFAGDAAYRRGIDSFNAFVKFDPPSAESVCPPAATYGLTTWHTVRAPNVAAGTLECYSDSAENHYYVWTDDGQRTIIVAESTSDQSFADLDAWWRQNNRNA